MIGYSERTSPMDVLYSKTGSFIDLRTISIEWLVFRELRSFQFSKFRSINYIRGRAFRVVSQRKVDIEGFGIAGWSVRNKVWSDLSKVNVGFAKEVIKIYSL